MMPENGTMTNEEIAREAHGQRFEINVSMRYHEERLKFWGGLSSAAKVFEFLTTSTAAVFLFQDKPYSAWVMLAAAFLSFLVIILEAQSRIKHNTTQKARMGELSIRIPHNLDALTEERLEEIIRERKRIELDDGIIFPCLLKLCYNAQCVADGMPEHMKPMTRYQKTAGWFLPVPYNRKA